MKIAYFDCIAGASGDMILGALIDAGLSQDELTKRLSALNLKDFELKFNQVNKNGFSATKVDVVVKNDVPERHLSKIKKIVNESNLDANIKEKAVKILHRLGEVEAKIHNSTIEKVHLHELGGVDTIVDVVGALIGIDCLNIKKIYCSPLPLGRGFIEGAHGQIPLPAPATIALLKDVPIIGYDLDVETITPTGAVLLSSLADSFGKIPDMKLSEIGYGAGGRNLPKPNILRLLIGETTAFPATKTLSMLETNIDDLNPEIYNYVMERLFEAGALDVFFVPIQMKKNRPATMLSVLCEPDNVIVMKEIIYTETSTLGIRQQTLQRDCLPRQFKKVITPYGTVQIKIATLPHGKQKIFPEYDDCKKLAASNKIPLQEIYQAALIAADDQ